MPECYFPTKNPTGTTLGFNPTLAVCQATNHLNHDTALVNVNARVTEYLTDLKATVFDHGIVRLCRVDRSFLLLHILEATSADQFYSDGRSSCVSPILPVKCLRLYQILTNLLFINRPDILQYQGPIYLF